MASAQSLLLTAAEATRYQQVDGSCKWLMTSGEFIEVQNLGDPAPDNDVMVYFVESFGASILGCGGHAPNEPACIVAAAGSISDTAHEVGHVLLGSSFRPVHFRSRRNLMFSVTSRSRNPVIHPRQVKAMKKSRCCRRILTCGPA